MYAVRPLPIIVLACALHLGGYQTPPAATFARTDPSSGNNPSPEVISAWETRLQADPENLQLRGSLLNYYAHSGPVDKYFVQALWMVQHHPESPYSALSATPRVSGGTLSAADHALLQSAWEQAVIDQADNGRVLHHAGLFFIAPDPMRAVQLFEQARQFDPENGTILKAEATVYVRAFLNRPSIDASNGQSLQREINASSDPALLVEVGSDLIRIGLRSQDSSLKPKGTELINRAINLDPSNEKWKTAAERAAVTPPPPSSKSEMSGPSGPVRIGSQVAEANLARRVNPEYPDMARHARISGTVEFTAIISEEGRIQNLQLVRGHPLLVNAAKDAVLQYQYKPTLLNGRPVQVMTSIIVPFQAPAQ